MNTLINVNQYPASHLSADERDFWGALELDEIDPPLSEDDAFDLINGRTFVAVWPDDEFPF